MRVVKKIPEGIRFAKDIYKQLNPDPDPEPEPEPKSGEAPKGGSLFRSFGDMFQSARSESHPYLESFQDGVSEHGMDYLKSAAAHVLNEHHHHDGPPILYHHHNVKADTRHFNRILHSTKNELHKAMRGNPLLKEAVSDAMHVAEKGGGIHWEHETGGALEPDETHVPEADDDSELDVATAAKALWKLADPIEEGRKTVKTANKIDLHDWSARGIAKNTLYGYSTNAHAVTTKLKADSLLVSGFEPLAQVGSHWGDQLSQWGDRI